jgi:DNA repair protein RecO
MSTIIKTEAVVLRAMKYRESSKIVTLYTRDHGKISTIVKGARQVKSKYGSSLEPMSYVSVVFYDKVGRDLQLLTQSDVISTFRHLYEDLEKMSAGMTMIELLNIIAHEQEENIPLFTLLVDSLKTLNVAEKNSNNIVYAFEIHLAEILGFHPTFSCCFSCGKSTEKILQEHADVYFHLSKGGLLCDGCSSISGQKVLLSKTVLTVLDRIASCSVDDELTTIKIDTVSRNEIENFLWNYLRFHVSGMRVLKSGKVFSKIIEHA